MTLNDGSSHYDILDIGSAASPQEVREAYIRTKATYNRDSIALYTIISNEEREEALRRIEEAYLILSNPEKRREYDHNFGILPVEDEVSKPVNPDNIISIDRVPPMENLPDGDSLLIPPTTDFDAKGTSPNLTAVPVAPYPSIPPVPLSATRPNPSPIVQPEPTVTHAIDAETEWSGPFLKKVRLAQKLSIEEMAGLTKITKTYIVAIEEENYVKLPAPVYIRGFVSQMAKLLKLPYERVATAYLSRFHRKQAK
jgi:hypothetical protein